MIITLKGADFSQSNIGTLDSWFISWSGSGLTPAAGNASSIKKDDTAGLTLTYTYNTENYEYVSGTVKDATGATVGSVSASNGTVTVTINAGNSINGKITIAISMNYIGTGEEPDTGGGSGSEGTDPTPGETITLALHKSAVGNSILDYQNVWKMFGAGSLATLGSQIIGVDVSAYAGQAITITAAQSVISGANYAMFCSNLPNAYIKSLGELDGYNSFGTASDYIAESYDNLIESFNISTVAETTNVVTKTVPTNAKYLFFSNLSNKCANPSVVVGNTTGTLTTYVTEYGWCCMDYQTYFYLTGNGTFQGYQSKVIALDVSDLVGETLSITATQSVVDEAYYSFFTNALPSGISSIEQINGLAYSDQTKYNFDESSLIESFNVSITNQTVNTITKVVPTGARYLFINTLDKFGSNDIKLV